MHQYHGAIIFGFVLTVMGTIIAVMSMYEKALLYFGVGFLGFGGLFIIIGLIVLLINTYTCESYTCESYTCETCTCECCDDANSIQEMVYVQRYYGVSPDQQQLASGYSQQPGGSSPQHQLERHPQQPGGSSPQHQLERHPQQPGGSSPQHRLEKHPRQHQGGLTTTPLQPGPNKSMEQGCVLSDAPPPSYSEVMSIPSAPPMTSTPPE